MIYILKSPFKPGSKALVEDIRSRIIVGMEAEIVSKMDSSFLSDNCRPHWIWGEDGSLRSEGAHRYTAELRSKICGLDDLGSRTDILENLSNSEAKVTANASCGFHVHVSLKGMRRDFWFEEGNKPSDYKEADANRDLMIFFRCVALSQKHIHALCGAAGRKNRFLESQYCKPVVLDGTGAKAAIETDRDVPEEYREALGDMLTPAYEATNIMHQMCNDSRNSVKYRHTAFHQFQSASKGLYEVRAFSGTGKGMKAYTFACMAASLLHYSAASEGGVEFPDKPTVDIARDSKFEESMVKFFEFMEWKAGGRQFGLPLNPKYPLEDMKAELIRLARKTDANTPNMTKEQLEALEASATEPSERELRVVSVPPAGNATSGVYRATPLGTISVEELNLPTDPANMTPTEVQGLYDRLTAAIARNNPTPAAASR